MSRSEHGNARDRTDPIDRLRKLRIKALTLAERLRHLVPEASSAAIPIVRFDHGPYVHWPASDADLRGVLDRLPAGTATGVACIACVVSKPERDACDPFVGRLAHQFVPGVYRPRVIGDYDPSGGRIQLYAYIYDPASHPLLEIYLRLVMLATFVHELGHHVDCRSRHSRHRARADRTEELERAADAWAQLQVVNAVVPYLEHAYPHEIAELRAWTLEHGGTVVPLELLVAASPTIFGTEEAFQILISDVLEGRIATDAMTDFAFYLHYGYHFELALESLARVISIDPGHADAARWRRHIIEDHHVRR